MNNAEATMQRRFEYHKAAPGAMRSDGFAPKVRRGVGSRALPIGSGQDAGLPDQRLRLLYRYAYQGCQGLG